MFHHIVALLFALLFAVAVRADGETWSDLTREAHQAEREGRYAPAKELLTKALIESDRFEITDPRRLETRVQLAGVLLELGEYARCKQICTESIGDGNAQNAEMLLQITQAEQILSRLYLDLGMSRLADDHCRRGLEICQSVRDVGDPDVADSDR